MFHAALLLKTSQIPLFLDVGLKSTVNYGVFGHLTFKNLAICSGFCLPGHKNLVKKNGISCRFVHVFVVVVVVGTNKDWGPENQLSEPILKFAWCSLGASMEFSTVLKNSFG